MISSQRTEWRCGRRSGSRSRKSRTRISGRSSGCRQSAEVGIERTERGVNHKTRILNSSTASGTEWGVVVYRICHLSPSHPVSSDRPQKAFAGIWEGAWATARNLKRSKSYSPASSRLPKREFDTTKPSVSPSPPPREHAAPSSLTLATTST